MSYWVWTSCVSTTRTSIGLKTPCQFVLDSCTVAVDASMVLGSIRARLVSASAWLRELCAEPDSDCFLVVVRPCDGQKEGENGIDS